MNTSTIPTESLNGNVLKQLYHGQPHLVFVQHEGGSFRCVCEVALNDAGQYYPIGNRMDWQGEPGDDQVMIAAEYLKQRRQATI